MFGREQEAKGSKGGPMRTERVRFRSQAGSDFETGGNVLMIAFRKLVVVGSLKNPSTRGWGPKVLIAVKCTHGDNWISGYWSTTGYL